MLPGWYDIVAISAGGEHTVGLRADGTVVTARMTVNARCYGQINATDWHNIKIPGAAPAPFPGGPDIPPRTVSPLEGNWRRANPDSGWHNVVVTVQPEYGELVGRVARVAGTGVAQYGVSPGDSKWQGFFEISDSFYIFMDFWLLDGGAWIEMYAYIDPRNPDVLYLDRTDGVTTAHGYSQRWVRIGDFEPVPGAYHITLANLHLRIGPSTGYRAIGLAMEGAPVWTISYAGDGWFEVDAYVDGQWQVGFMYGEWLEFAE